MKYCDFNGCSNKITKGAYCDEHKRSKKSSRSKSKKKDIYHHDNKSFYNSKAWRGDKQGRGGMRDFIYERDRGCCQRCGKFIFGRRAHVHHIIEIKKDPLLKLEPNNLRLLCPKCHIVEENEDKQKKIFPSYFK